MVKISVFGVYLAWHNFTIDSTDIDSSIEAGLVMCIHYITPKGLVCSCTTVVGSLQQLYQIQMRVSSDDQNIVYRSQKYLKKNRRRKNSNIGPVDRGSHQQAIQEAN